MDRGTAPVSQDEDSVKVPATVRDAITDAENEISQEPNRESVVCAFGYDH
jgi:hypothetical protein